MKKEKFIEMNNLIEDFRKNNLIKSIKKSSQISRHLTKEMLQELLEIFDFSNRKNKASAELEEIEKCKIDFTGNLLVFFFSKFLLRKRLNSK